MPPKDEAKRRKIHCAAQARYKTTAKGMLTDLRYEAKRRGNRGKTI